jgi:putative FmdB family regulatory protein
MAIYEFDGATCGERVEVSCPMSDHDRLKQPPPACPKCGAADTHQRVPLITAKATSG